MLKRLVKEATSGFSSSGEQSARRKDPASRRSTHSSDDNKRGEQKKSNRKEADSGSRSSRRRPASSKDESADENEVGTRKTSSRKPADDTPTEEESTSARRKKSAKNDDARRKTAGRMKREPLLEYSVIETIHSALHGKKKKSARHELLELFGLYDSEDTGSVDAEKFKKCIAKVGIKLKRSSDIDALIKCFAKGGSGGQDDREDSSDDISTSKSKSKVMIDYVAFADFACNVRDSEKLSAVATKLREVIHVYNDRHDRTTTVPYNISTDLKKLDKNKRGWLASDRFSDFMHDHERPTFQLSPKEIDRLKERFEYEYDKGTLGFDYVLFARWLQPMLHLDKKELHKRVKQLIEAAQATGGWDLGELFEAIDESGDGHVSASELKQAMFDMGLPLTDAQIQCLVEEYDLDGDGKIQYEEFVSLFKAPQRKRTPRQQDNDDESDQDQKKRTKAKAKANVRNTFSWAITKAFARKHAAQASKSTKSSKTTKRRSDSSSSSDGEEKQQKPKRSNTKREVLRSDSLSEEETSRSSRLRSKRMPSKKVKASSEDSVSSDTKTKATVTKSSQKPSAKPKKRVSKSSTESESDRKKPSHRHKKEDINSEESSQTNARRRRRSEVVDMDSQVEATKRKGRARSTTTVRSQKTSRPRSRSARQKSRVRSANGSGSPERTRRPRQTKTRSSQNAHVRPRFKQHNCSDESIHGKDSDRHSAGSLSGLDLDQVRKLQGQPRNKKNRGNQSLSEDEYDSDSDAADVGDESKSDRTYHTILKKSLRRAFDFFDNDHTETISKRNIGHVLRALGHEYSSRELDREIYRADLDKNGEMDFHEFLQLVKRQLMLKAYLLSPRREMEIRQAFQSLDVSKSGSLGDNEFEFLVYKVLQVELSVEEQDALLDAVENAGDGTVYEDDFLGFMKTMEGFHMNGVISKKRQQDMLRNLDPVSRLACSAVKKLIRGAPMDLDKNLLALLGVPTNFRPALTSAAVCRELHEVSMEYALCFPCPETIVGLAQDPVRIGTKKESSGLNLGKATTAELPDDEAKIVLQQAETRQAHAIVSLKRATGVPKPFDTREEDVVKRCVHVAWYQEQEDPTRKRRRHRAKDTSGGPQPWRTGGGAIIGNVHEIPVYWNKAEEDIWEFSRKSTKEDKYKFVVRSNNINDRLFLLVEFIVHLRTNSKLLPRKKRNTLRISDTSNQVHEMAACWCKIPIRTLLAQRLDVYRMKEKLWGGTVDSPIDIEQDEILRRRTGWRAITNAFTKPTPPTMGIKSAPIETYPDEIRAFVRKMPPLIIAPFLSLPIVAEYMTAMQNTMWLKSHVMAANLCEPALKLLPRIVDDHEALSVFRRAFDAEVNGVKNQEDRQKKFQELVLRMWPSFLDLLDKVPQATLQDAKATSTSTRRLSILSPTANAAKQAPPAKGTTNESPPDHLARFDLLQCSVQGKIRLRNVPVAAAPFHVREVTFERLI